MLLGTFLILKVPQYLKIFLYWKIICKQQVENSEYEEGFLSWFLLCESSGYSVKTAQALEDEQDWGWEVWSKAGLDHPGQHGAGHNSTILAGQEQGYGSKS